MFDRNLTRLGFFGVLKTLGQAWATLKIPLLGREKKKKKNQFDRSK